MSLVQHNAKKYPYSKVSYKELYSEQNGLGQEQVIPTITSIQVWLLVNIVR